VNSELRHGLETDTLQEIIKSLHRDIEEKRFELSQLRLLADAMADGLHETDYFNRACTALNSIFRSSVAAIFWIRRRTPAGWWLGAWASHDPRHYPLQSIIPHDLEGSLGEVFESGIPAWIENAAGEPIVEMWGFPSKEPPSMTLIPLRANGLRSGMLVIINPVLKVSAAHRQQHLEMLQAPINTGVFNRLLYKNTQESEEELRDLFENSSDMVVVAYHDGVIRDCNRAFRSTIGLKEEPRGRRLEDILDEEKGTLLDEIWVRLLSGEEVRNVDMRLKHADGSIIDVELSGNARTLLSGRPGIIRLYLRDLTERRKAERRQRELELEIELAQQRQLAQVGLYVSGIAHNLQNPVQVLLGYINLLKGKGTELAELDEIEKSTERIMGIIRNLLLKMRQEQDTSVVTLDINDLLNNELTFLNANQFYKHQVEKQFEFDPNLPTIRATYSDLSQCIMNLVYNALEAMNDAEKRVLGVRTKYDLPLKRIIIEVDDTGPGIPAELKERIFEPFFSTKRDNGGATHDLHGGSGLGLSSSLALLKPYGGMIDFESEPDKGTKFRLTIPVTETKS